MNAREHKAVMSAYQLLDDIKQTMWKSMTRPRETNQVAEIDYAIIDSLALQIDNVLRNLDNYL